MFFHVGSTKIPKLIQQMSLEIAGVVLLLMCPLASYRGVLLKQIFKFSACMYLGLLDPTVCSNRDLKKKASNSTHKCLGYLHILDVAGHITKLFMHTDGL